MILMILQQWTYEKKILAKKDAEKNIYKHVSQPS